MDTNHLVRMANQIATFFAAYPEPEAIAETATHLSQFWDRRMRDKLAQHVAAGGEGLTPIALAAAQELSAAAAARESSAPTA